MSERTVMGEDFGKRRQVHASAGQSVWRKLVQYVVIKSGDG